MVSGVATVALGSMLSLCVASGARAERFAAHPQPVAARPRTFAARPRVNEVNQRLMFQQHRIAEGVNHGQINGWHGQINGWHAERDMRRDERVERQMRGDEAMHDGHLASFEQRRLNQELDRNSVHIYDERHPDGQFPRR